MEVETYGLTAALLFCGDAYSGKKSKAAQQKEDLTGVVSKVASIEKTVAGIVSGNSSSKSAPSNKKSKGRGKGPASGSSKDPKPSSYGEVETAAASSVLDKIQETCQEFNKGD